MDFRRGGDPPPHLREFATYLRIKMREACLLLPGFQTCRQCIAKCTRSCLECTKSGSVSVWFFGFAAFQIHSKKKRAPFLSALRSKCTPLAACQLYQVVFEMREVVFEMHLRERRRKWNLVGAGDPPA